MVLKPVASNLDSSTNVVLKDAGTQGGHRKVLTVDTDLCTGCRSCEIACSAFHYKESNPMRSMIRVVYDFQRDLAVPIMCEQCEEPVCKKVCPTNAIQFDPSINAFTIDEKRCVGCVLCITACRLGGLSIDLVTRKAKMCDLCSGDPQCVKMCSKKALNFTENFRVGTEKKRIAFRKLLEGQTEDSNRSDPRRNTGFHHIHEEVC